VGKVHRSRTRNFWEDAARFVIPVYSVYRCHNCNWRGWLARGGSSSTKGRIVLGAYALVIVSLLVALAVTIIRNWPTATFEY
jgi:hypothetical protein